MPFDAPGRADRLSPALGRQWNETIQRAYERLRPEHGSRFFASDPQTVAGGRPAAITWFADPAEPSFCVSPEAALRLSDWGVRGRHVLHDEYCEYRILERPDGAGRLRPKRVEITTELREYWVCVAKNDPQRLRTMLRRLVGFLPPWQDLYGVADPAALTPQQREVAFSRLVAGNGGDRELEGAGVPTQPSGALNTEHALFMTHPINGLDDLLYIVMFGARPYASRDQNGQPQPATREQIFREERVEHLACRHADPAAAVGAHGAAFEGRTVAFADPLGMYIQSFTRDVFLFRGDPVPDAWVRFSRGRPGQFQRLEFGPPDDSPAFLDDITVATGADETPLTGGYQLLQQLEVGPRIVIGPPSAVADTEFVVVTASDAPVRCGEAGICNEIRRLQTEHDASGASMRVAPRMMRAGPR